MFELIKAKDGLMVRNFGDKYIVVAVGKMADDLHSLITLNSSGLFIWEKLQQGIEYDDLLNDMLIEYDIDRETAKTDLDAFLNNARDAKLLNE